MMKTKFCEMSRRACVRIITKTNLGGLLWLSIAVSFIFIGAPIGSASTTNVYIAQSSAGVGNGADCADALPVSWFNNRANWGTGANQIGPGTAVHFCGMFSGTVGQDLFTAQGSGASGNPITLLAEPGALFTSPAWGYVLYTNGFNYFIVDGGTSHATIQNTDNGSTLGNQVGTIAFSVTGSHDVEIRNWTISNLYIHSSATDTTMGNPYPTCLTDFGNSSNISFHDNVAHDLNWCVGAVGSGLQVYNNEFYHMDHGVGGGDSGVSNISIHDNRCHDFITWDTVSNAYHHDCVHLFAAGNGFTGSVSSYNNYTYGDMGAHNNACDYYESNGAPFSGLTIFNEVCTTTNPAGFGSGCIGMGNNVSSVQILNNTCTMPLNSGTNFALWITGGTNITVENNVISSNGALLLEIYSAVGTITLDYNDFYSGGGRFDYKGTNYGSFAAYQSGSGQDSHSVGTNPNLNAGLQCQPSMSPCYRSGANLSSLGLAALDTSTTKGGLIGAALRPASGGSNWDMGAFYGFSSTQPAPPSGLSVIGQ